MAHYPQNATGLQFASYPTGPSINPSSPATAAGSAHTKGSWAELVSATPFACNSMYVGLSGLANNVHVGLVDIGVGPAGSEQVLLSNLIEDQDQLGSSIGNTAYTPMPIALPAGVRLAARYQSDVASRQIGVYVTLAAAGGTPGLPGPFTTYGATTGTSRGTNVDPGASANTKGAYSQLTAATTDVAHWIMFLISKGAQAHSGEGWAIDIATGAAGAETVLIPDLRVQCPGGTSAGCLGPRSYAMLTYIPRGTRLAVRASCNVATAPNRTFDCILITSPSPPENEQALAFVGS